MSADVDTRSIARDADDDQTPEALNGAGSDDDGDLFGDDEEDTGNDQGLGYVMSLRIASPAESLTNSGPG